MRVPILTLTKLHRTHTTARVPQVCVPQERQVRRRKSQSGQSDAAPLQGQPSVCAAPMCTADFIGGSSSAADFIGSSSAEFIGAVSQEIGREIGGRSQ